jgi:hypothetical protein
MRIYFDVCTIQRPFDDASQLRVHFESEAFLRILERIRSGEIQLVSSFAHVMENDANPHRVRREFAERVLALASEFVGPNDEVEARGREYRAMALRMLDATHLAVAVACRADFFCTCDDRLLRRAKPVTLA